MKLNVNSAVCGYREAVVLENISLSVSSSEILCLLGPNGVGKTTLFKTILGFLKLKGGSIRADGEDLGTWTRKKYAQKIGYVPQTHTPPFPFTVFDVVAMGRTAHMGSFASPSKEDLEIAEKSLNDLGILWLRDRIYTEISGGERQMVLIARALTQQPELLVMDEPTSNLDFGNQLRVLKQIRKLAESGMGIMMTTHFPDHAFLCASRVALLSQSGFFIGTPDEIITEESLRAVYGVDVKIVETPVDGGHVEKACIPILS
ncbi:putative ABC transporter ATP-binding protein [Oscillibacter valericigenes Sjm18-20]|nr:putative ABC transporter ATP-binding protein [Oscillibacter valericigenes Sjm18-20]